MMNAAMKKWGIAWAITLFVSVAIFAADGKDGPVGDWRFDEGSGVAVRDNSSSGNNGKILSAESCKWVNDPDKGTFLRIDNVRLNDKYCTALVRVENNPSLQLPETFTLLLRFSCDTEIIRKPFPFAALLTKGWDYSSEYAVMVRENGDLLVNLKGITPEYQIYKCGIQPNTDTAVAIVCDGEEVRVFVDGKLKGSTKIIGKPVAGNGLLTLGNMEHYDYKFKGNLYQVKIFRRTLSEEELSQFFREATAKTAAKTHYLVEKTANLIRIDAQIDDFGKEDALHVWHPPKNWIDFGTGGKFTAPDAWQGEKDLSGRMVIKYDDRYLYFAAEVNDDAVLSDASSEWENDGIEFFLSCLPHQRESVKRLPGDYQILLSPRGLGTDKPRLKILDYQGAAVSLENTEIFAVAGHLKTGNREYDGYFIKAKIPLDRFPELRKNTLGYVDYQLIVNDRDHNKFNRWFLADTPPPHRSVKKYRHAYWGKEVAIAEDNVVSDDCIVTAREYSIPRDLLADDRKSDEIGIWDARLAAREKNGARETLYLNGIWAEQTFENEPKQFDGGQWNYLAVPIDPFAGPYNPVAYFTVKDDRLTPIPWGFYQKRSIQAARVYFRSIQIDQSWQNARVLLDIAERGIAVNCEIWVNGKKVSGAPSGPLDVTGLLRYGEKNDLLIKAVPSSDDPSVLVLGDVRLIKVSPVAVVESCVVSSSVENQRLKVDFTVAAKSPDDLYAEAEIFDCADGKKLQGIPRQRMSELKSVSGDYSFAVAASLPRWSFESPRLCRLILRLTDADGKLVDEESIRFGFREIELRGRDLLVNGVKTHLRIFSLQQKDTRETLELAKQKGFNAVLLNFNIKYSPEFLLNWLDELGMYAIVMPGVGTFQVDDFFLHPEPIRYMRKHINHPSAIIWQCDVLNTGKEAGWSQWNYHEFGTGRLPAESEMGKMVARENRKKQLYFQNNDPSRIVMHYTSGNHPPIASTMNHSDFGLPLQESGGGAEVWANLPDPAPFIMLESWPWAGTGINLDFWRLNGSVKAPATFSREGVEWSYAVEQATQYFGEQAYRWAEPIRTVPLPKEEFDAYWTHFHNNFQAPRRWERACQYLAGSSRRFGFSRINPAETALLAAGTREQLRADRGYGLTGRCTFARLSSEPLVAATVFDRFRPYREFYLPAANRQTRIQPYEQPFGAFPLSEFALYHTEATSAIAPDPVAQSFDPLLEDASAPVLFYLGGGPDPADFRRKDHAFWAGEQVRKHLVIVNDREREIKLDTRWQLFDAKTGEVLADGRPEVRVGAGETGKIPLEFTMPETAQKRPLRLTVTARDPEDQKEFDDHFLLDVYPRPTSVAALAAAVYEDGNQQASALLAAAGIPAERLTDPARAGEQGILIIGKNSLSGFLRGCPPAELNRKISDGLRVLVMEQNPEAVYGPRLKELRLRDLFIKAPLHPALAGFSDADFAQWRGNSTHCASKPQWEPSTEYCSYYLPQMFGNWGTEGIVSSFVLSRPQYGNVKTLLAGGFDQDWSALAEVIEGRGVLLLSQLDLCGRDQSDPAGIYLLRNLVFYLRDFRSPELGPAAFLGTAQNRSLLERFAVSFTENPTAARLLIADATSAGAAEKRQWLENQVRRDGKTLLLLWPEATDDLSWIAPDLKITLPKDQNRFFKAILSQSEKQNWLLNGLSSEDFYYKFYRSDLPLITKVPEDGEIFAGGLLASFPSGKGRVVVCQIRPSQHDRDRSLPKAVRSLAILLNNLGVDSSYRPMFADPALELSRRTWRFRTDPDNRGDAEKWFSPEFNDSSWQELQVGKSWESQGVTQDNPNLYNAPRTSYNGTAWYRCRVDFPADTDKTGLFLEIAAVAGDDEVYFNGHKIGATDNLAVGALNVTCYYRNYPIPPELIRPGKNLVAVKVRSISGIGGLSKWPVRILSAASPNQTALLPMEKDRFPGDPYRFIMW